MSSYSAFKSILAPRSQAGFVFTALKIVLALFFIVQLIIIALLFMIATFQLQFERLFDLFITFGIFGITFFGIGFESLPILVISTVYFLIFFFDSFLNSISQSLILYGILFSDGFGLLLFTYLTKLPDGTTVS